MKKELFRRIKASKDSHNIDMDLVEKAFIFAHERHEGQFREGTGEPYIVHPVNVAVNLLEYDVTTEGLCAALLHDTVEDTHTELNEIKDNFGDVVAFLVDGVTKIEHHDPQIMLDINRKKVLSFAQQDSRVIKLKIADAQHNLSTLKFVNPQRRRNLIYKTKILHTEYARTIGMHEVAEDFLRITQKHEEDKKNTHG